MIRGEIDQLEHTHEYMLVCSACVSFSSLICSRSSAVGGVSKPRRGHPLVEFLIVIGVECLRLYLVDNQGPSLVHTRACT